MPQHCRTGPNELGIMLPSQKHHCNLQSLDAGITGSFKLAYCRALVSLFIEHAEEGAEATINMTEAIHMVHHAGQSVTHCMVMKHWNHTSILRVPSSCDLLDDEHCSLAKLYSLTRKLRSNL